MGRFFDSLYYKMVPLQFPEDFWKNKVILGLSSVAVSLYLTMKYFHGGVCRSKAKLDGKTVIVTGCNTGIGKETAKDLAKRGAKVIMACRNLDRANKAAEEIKSSISDASIRVMKLDLASFSSVRQFAKEFLETEKCLDILINNAGLLLKERAETEDGHEMTLQCNHLGHFLLTNLLLDKLKEAPKARIVNVSSIGHKWSKLDLSDLNYTARKFDGMVVYYDTKLINILFTNELTRRLQDTNVTSYVLHPGV